MFNKRIYFSVALLILCFSIAAGVTKTAYAAEKLPTLSIGYMFSNHQAPLIIAARQGEAFADKGVYLKEVLPKEKYILNAGGKDIANIDIVVANNGGEVMTMMVQGQLQMALTSIGLPLTNIDKGATMKVLGPIHADGIGLIGANSLPANNFDEFIAYVKKQEQPVKIGYHSPANAPVILFEESCRALGLKVTEDPTDLKADILLINLKGTANLMPALASGEVEAWVGPSPFPEMALLQKAGKLIIDLKDLPPSGRWTDFPCCVFSASDEALQKNRAAIEQFYKLLTVSSEFANNNKAAAGQIVSDWMGVNLKAAQNTMTVYTTDANKLWLDHCALTYSVLQKNGSFKGALKDKSMDQAMNQIFDLSVYENAKKK